MGYRLTLYGIDVNCETVDDVIALAAEKKKQDTGYREHKLRKLHHVKKQRRQARLF